ncbi:MAG: hypothetical protein NW223_03260 [Hyphomicrobiaceae bacterium]|nr:hypothetical protein [Hyphomicrobiaceae bacterium]
MPAFFQQPSAAAAVARLRRVATAALATSGTAGLTLSIPATGEAGFAIELRVARGRGSAAFGPLQCEFETEQGAWTWLERALSARYRLRVVSVAGREREWHLEPADMPGEALASGTLAVLASWRPRAVELRRNSLSFDT